MSTSTTTATPKLFGALSLACSAIGVVLFAVFLFSMAGAALAWSALIAGLLGVILAIVALVKREGKGLAVTGLVLGSLVTLLVLGLFVFALIFVGAITI